MLSCTPKNKSACANSDERGCRILRGSDRSAKFGLQLGDIGRDPPRFILREHFAALLVADDKAGVQFLDRPGRGGKRRAGMA